MRLRLGVFLHLLLFASLIESAAHAFGSTWADGTSARIVHERDIILFDPDTKTEHLVVQVRFQTDAKVNALIVPMPAAPLADHGYGVEDEIVFFRLESIVRYDDPKFIPDAPESEMLAQANARTAQSTVIPDPSALGDWLKLEKLRERASLTQWLSRYSKRGWALNGVKLTDDDSSSPTRIMQSPALRFSFPAEQAILPYTESPPQQSGSVKGNSLDVWVVAPTPVDLVQADPTSGRMTFGGVERRSSTRVSSAELEGAVGRLGSFDPKSRPQWIVSRFTERGKGPRAAVDDLSVVEARPFGESSSTSKHKVKKAWLVLALGLAAAIAFALWSQRK